MIVILIFVAIPIISVILSVVIVIGTELYDATEDIREEIANNIGGKIEHIVESLKLKIEQHYHRGDNCKSMLTFPLKKEWYEKIKSDEKTTSLERGVSSSENSRGRCKKKQMHKIIFEFSETSPDDATITGEATNAEIIFAAAAALVGDIADNIREKTGEPKEKAEERALAMIQEMLVEHTRKCKNRHQTMGDIK